MIPLIDGTPIPGFALWTVTGTPVVAGLVVGVIGALAWLVAVAALDVRRQAARESQARGDVATSRDQQLAA